MLQSYLLLGTLGVHSIEDIRKRKITVNLTLFSGILGILLHLFYQNQSIYSMLAGMLSGAFIVALGWVTGGAIGIGDGLVFMLTGLYLGLEANVRLMLLSFLLAGIWALFLLLVLRRGRKERMPLVPFLFLGYLLICLWRGVP